MDTKSLKYWKFLRTPFFIEDDKSVYMFDFLASLMNARRKQEFFGRNLKNVEYTYLLSYYYNSIKLL